ncbi:MAG: hypothetical protein QOD61_762 [Solirubrobacteraceae bacterium]|nr:hypothetical protein [Solirubrobacteraceae bacterium]
MSPLRRILALTVAVGAASACLAAPALADVAILRSTMSGAAEVPGPGDPSATGTSQIILDSRTGRVCYTIHVSQFSGTLTAAHIHRAPAGTAGPVVIPFRAPVGGFTAGCTIADRALVQAIIDNPSAYYTNVHSTVFPGGAARGQLTSVITIRTPAVGSPVPVGSARR